MPLLGQRVTRVHRIMQPETYVYESDSSHSYLGVEVNDISSNRASELKLKDDNGVEITEVDQDAPAGKAGLKEHDVITGFNGTPVESEEQFRRLMRETPAGRTVALNVIRDGQLQTVKVQLADRRKFMPSSNMIVGAVIPRNFAPMPPTPVPPMPAMPAMPEDRFYTDQPVTRIYRSISGVTLESLSPQLGDFFGVKNAEGMLVRSVQKGSPADNAGLRAGDVIVRAGDQKITDHSDWAEALRNTKDGKLPVVVIRDKREQTLPMNVSPRRGPDSSAWIDESSPAAAALGDAAAELNDLGPQLQEQLSLASKEASDALCAQQKELALALNKSMSNLQSQMRKNQGEIDRNLKKAMSEAAASIKAQQPELQRELRKMQRELDDMQ